MYWCQGCGDYHTIKTKGDGAWNWNGDIHNPVITPSVKVTWAAIPDAPDEFKEWRTERICHTYIGCNGALPGQVIFLGDCTHALAGQIHPFPDIPIRLTDYASGDNDETD